MKNMQHSLIDQGRRNIPAPMVPQYTNNSPQAQYPHPPLAPANKNASKTDKATEIQLMECNQNDQLAYSSLGGIEK